MTPDHFVENVQDLEDFGMVVEFNGALDARNMTFDRVPGSDVSTASFDYTDVFLFRALAIEVGSYAEAELIAVVQLGDGRWASMEGGCDVTGWDTGGCVITFGPTEESVVRFGLTDAGREALGLKLPVEPFNPLIHVHVGDRR